MKKVTLAILLVALMFVYASEIMADEFKLIPSLAVRGEYNDNLFFTENDEKDDYITTVSARLELIERTQRLDLDLSATVSPFFYADYDDLDDVDQNYLGRVGYRISPLFGINANALYDVSNRRDRDIETAGLVLSNDERKRQEYGLGFDYTLTEKASMALSLGYLQDTWDTENLDQQDLEDYSAGLNFIYNLSQWWASTTGRLNFGFERYKFELLNTETSDTYNYFGTIGAQHWFSETVNLIVDLGVQYTDSDFLTPLLVEDNNTEFGGTGQAILEIRGELTRGSMRIGHAIRPGSGSGTTVERSDVVFNLRRRLAERSVIAIATGFYKNKADRGDYSFREIDENTYFIRPNIRWEFFENFTLEAGYDFVYVDDRVVDEDTKRNLVYLNIAYGLPLFE
jgi:hypothetical protein